MNFTYLAMFILFLVLVIVILKLTKLDQENNLEYEYSWLFVKLVTFNIFGLSSPMK
jgi:hypothetical protein